MQFACRSTGFPIYTFEKLLQILKPFITYKVATGWTERTRAEALRKVSQIRLVVDNLCRSGNAGVPKVI